MDLDTLDEILDNLKKKESKPRQLLVPVAEDRSVLELLAKSPLPDPEKRAAAWALQWMVRQGNTPAAAIKKYVSLYYKK